MCFFLETLKFIHKMLCPMQRKERSKKNWMNYWVRIRTGAPGIQNGPRGARCMNINPSPPAASPARSVSILMPAQNWQIPFVNRCLCGNEFRFQRIILTFTAGSCSCSFKKITVRTHHMAPFWPIYQVYLIPSIAAEILSLKSFLYRQTSSIGACRFFRLQRIETLKRWTVADAGCKIVSHVIK